MMILDFIGMAERPTFISHQVLEGRYLVGDLEPSPRQALAVVCAGREVCADNYRIQRDSFRYHAVEMIVSGSWRLATLRGEWTLGPGSLFAYGPRTPYEMTACGGKPLVKCFVDFVGSASRRLLRDAHLEGTAPLETLDPSWNLDAWDELLACAHYRKPAMQEMAGLWLRLMLRRLAEEPADGRSAGGLARETYLRCHRYLRDHFATLHNAEDAARRCGLSPAYLTRLFQRFGDEAPHAYLVRLKLQAAAIQLRRSRASVKEVALRTGFSDPYHFSRVFKRHFGVAPSDFAGRTLSGRRS